MKPLRTCRICGVEAFTLMDLEGFVRHNRMDHGRDNECKRCSRKRTKPLFKDIQNRTTEYLGIRTIHPVNPRTNKCERCGKTYPDELVHQTCLAIEGELCHSCMTTIRPRSKDGKFLPRGMGVVKW